MTRQQRVEAVAQRSCSATEIPPLHSVILMTSPMKICGKRSGSSTCLIRNSRVGASDGLINDCDRALGRGHYAPSERRLCPDLDALLKAAIAVYESMSPEEKEAMHKAQAESWVRGEMELGKDPRTR